MRLPIGQTNQFIEDAARLHEKMKEWIDIAERSCINCCFFKENEGELCTRAIPPARPPARIIVDGCSEFDTIPF